MLTSSFLKKTYPMHDIKQAKIMVDTAITALRAGIPVILTDDADRENEGDLMLAADSVTIPLMAFFIRECSGIVCLCLSEEKLDALNLPPMVENNQSRYQTPFALSIEAREGVTTGVSAADRVQTIKTAIAPDAKSSDIVSPGHVFPLRAKKDGVLARRGHTEGSVDLAKLAGFSPAAIICELMNPDGSMMRGKALQAFSAKHSFPIVTIAALVSYRSS